MRKILAVLFTIAFFSVSARALAGQTVEIKSNITKDPVHVHGNSNVTELASNSGNQCDMNPNGNTVNTNGYSVTGAIYGGRSHGSYKNANGNTIYITGKDGVFGSMIVGGYASSGEVVGNAVNISGGSVNGKIYGGYSVGGETAGNMVKITDGIFIHDIYGGYTTKTATNNYVNISDGSFNGKIYGGYSVGGKATGNTVNISGGSFSGNIYGGYSESGEAACNTMNISGGSFSGNIYGGYSKKGGTSSNTVNISGSPDLGNAGLFGDGADSTLNLYSMTTVKEMGYFQNLNFYLPEGYVGNGATLTVSGNADIDGAIVGVGINGASSPLRAGDTIKLIGAGKLTGAPGNDGRKAIGLQGVTLQYEFVIGLEGDDLFATVTADDPGDTGGIGDEEDPENIEDAGNIGDTGVPDGAGGIGGSGGVTVTNLAKALPEGLSANVAAINNGGDLISGAMKTQWNSSSESGSRAFGTASFGKSRYNTGSHVDSDTLAVLAGVQLAEIKLGGAALSCGIFAEAGWNSYGTFNDFADAPDVRGYGESNYFGGGLALRADYGGNGRGWFYNDAAIRFGRARNSFACDGEMTASYKTDSPYYGGHIGLGYVRELKNGAKLDIGARLLWTRLEGDSATLRTKDPITFARSDSLRGRVGARYETERFYAGLAYEYEFAGDANATAYGFPIPAPSLKGGVGICDLGFTLGKKNATFGADLHISAFTGKREGFAAGINLNWKL
jgi:hypothetical protein